MNTPLDDDLRNELLPIFKGEAEDHLQALTRDLLALEKNPEPEEASQLFEEIFRTAHTLKGSARAVGLDAVAALAHRLESLFGSMQRGAVAPTPEALDHVYRALDAIAALVRGVGGEAPAVDVPALSAELESITRNSGQQQQPEVLPGAALQRAAPPPPTVERFPAPQLPRPAPAPAPGADSDAAGRVPANSKGGAEDPAKRAHDGGPADETVRVAVGKLDALVSAVFELQAARISTDQRLSEVQTLADEAEDWEATWRRLRPQLRAQLAAHQIGQERHGRGPAAEAAMILDLLEATDTRSRRVWAAVRALGRQLQADSRRMAQVTSDLQDDVRRTRLMPASSVFDPFSRVVRDLARELGKEVRLVVEGAETELDRSLLEQIKAPLLHLLRNSVDHGVEQPEVREQAGKPREGTISLSASQRGSHIFIQIADDGAGIDPVRVKEAAIGRGIVPAESARTMSDREARWLIFRSGFSTRTATTDVSGRGVGMDVVRQNIDRLQGVIDLDSEVGKGTRISLTLPLTVATTLCLLARAGSETVGIPLMNIARIIRLGPGMVGQAQGCEVVQDDGRPVLLTSLADVVGIAGVADPAASRRRYALVLGVAERRAAFAVDQVLGAQEVLVKRLPQPFRRVRHAAGAAILGNGQVVVVLDTADLLRSAAGATAIAGRKSRADVPKPSTSPLVLVADDSITTRTLERNILEAAGYRVRVVPDGLEAWLALQNAGEGRDNTFSLLLSDITMPRMNGLELTEKVRQDERLKHLPVILVSALGSREDRERGVTAGADAYIAKDSFDQDALLATIRQLI